MLLWCVALALWGGPAAVQAADPQPGELVHLVRPGETLSEIAVRYGVDAAALAAANGISNPDRIVVGQRLRVPAAEGLQTDEPLPRPLVWARTLPAPTMQGSTVAVQVVVDGPAELQGWLGQQRLHFALGPDGYWAWAGISPLADLGCLTLRLEARRGLGLPVSWSACLPVVDGGFATQRIPLSPAMSSLLADQRALQQEAERVAQVFARVSGGPLWRGTFRVPLEPPLRVTGAFGDRRAYGNAPPSSFHAGIDLDGDLETVVHAPASGRVALAEPLLTRGNAVILDHGLGVMSGYWHLSQIAVQEGQWVQPGDLLGYVGSTGLSTGPHLHWELRVGGVAVDPMAWADGRVGGRVNQPLAALRAKGPGRNVPE
ncbi:MAG: peptidoglycan DD-metalloendopeptidase family protein [Chloroflexi bacterium]|nr:peptidoglycan DD-metalloendopeptidase family protein [Chloroflexota bacterium]